MHTSSFYEFTFPTDLDDQTNDDDGEHSVFAQYGLLESANIEYDVSGCTSNSRFIIFLSWPVV